ncbi:CDP-6-deoxy-delta-3,4-glucoseen reductase [Thiobacter aerophilum]|uniref:CDP-6-deoxy-delta-3,4-glucoseen reductase n=1 Tax=Thiobacter aerophilum TaxID=3121275 RepID=A0ABV0EDN2_9BURK
MPFYITIQPSGHRYEAEDQETVLESALRHGFTLPYGCRNGACGSCKGKILSGQVDYGDYQSTALTDEEKAAGFALFCRARPLSDLVIESREVSAARDIQIKTIPCRVQKIERVSDDVAVLYLKLPASERLQFLAGQYIDILLKDGKRRSFSLANAPHDDALLQLHVRHVPGGAFTEYVFTTMQEKTILRFEGPLGTFFLREDSDKPIIMLATGTGFAPIKSMLEHAFHVGIRRPITLYWGGRHRDDLYMLDLPQQWAQTQANFTFVPVLSRPTAEDQWNGRTGHVQDCALADHPDIKSYEVYACGSPEMVSEAHRVLVAAGLPEEAFYSDAFTPAKDSQPQPTT